MKYKKRIVVTGGAGFIGSHYLNYAVKKYPRELFINVDALTSAADLRNLTIQKRKNYAFEKADISDFPEMLKVFETYEPTDVLHFAAETHVDQSIVNSSIFVKTNVLGTENLLELSRKHRISRFHLISTDEVYGALELKDRPFTEDSPYNPRNPYSATKAAAELLLHAYMHTYNLPGVITRSSNNYGPRQDQTKLIPKFISNLLQGKKLPLYATGENIRNWIYVDDNVRAIDLVFRKGANGRVYNIGGDDERSNIEVAKIIIRMFKKTDKEIEFVEDRPGHDFRYALSIERINDELFWKPQVKFEEGLKKTIAFYKKRLRA